MMQVNIILFSVNEPINSFSDRLKSQWMGIERSLIFDPINQWHRDLIGQTVVECILALNKCEKMKIS